MATTLPDHHHLFTVPNASVDEILAGTGAGKAVEAPELRTALNTDLSQRLAKDQNLSDLVDPTAGRLNLGFPATASRYLRNDGSGVPAAVGAAESANLDEVSSVDPGTTGKDILAAATPKVSRTKQAVFDSVADLLSDTSLAYTLATNKVLVAVNDFVQAGIHRYRVASSAATDYNLLTAGGVKLYVQVGALGALHAMAFGALADNTPRALSFRYATLAAAEAAFPRIKIFADEMIVAGTPELFPSMALTDQFDWACAQECILAAGNTLNIPSVHLGFGNYRINRALYAGGPGKGLVIFGTAITAPQQGSSKAGTCIRYLQNVGADAGPIMRIRGTHTYPENLSFENFGNADCAVDMTGPTSGSGIGRNNMRNISAQQSVGTFPYATAVFRIHNGSDYTGWENIEYAGTSPIVIDLGGLGDAPGGTTCFSLNRSVFSIVPGAPSNVIGLKVSATNAERIMVRHTSFNNIRTTGGGLTAVNTMDIDPLLTGNIDVDNLLFEFSETDTIANDGNVRFAELNRVRLAHFRNSIGSGNGGSTSLIEATDSNVHVSDLAVHSIAGPVVNCTDAVSRVTASGNFWIPSAQTISNTSTANITSVTQAASVTIYGAETLFGAEKTHTYKFPLTTNANMTITARDFSAAPYPRWRIGQKVYWVVENASGGAAGTITFSGGFKVAAYTAPANGFSNSFLTEWNGTHHVQRSSLSPDIPN